MLTIGVAALGCNTFRDTGQASSDALSSDTDAVVDADPDTDGQDAEPIEVNEHITEDTTWQAENTYVLSSPIFVADGATLTIEAGTRVVSTAQLPLPAEESERNTGALIVTRGAQLVAVGSADAPIVFTSAVTPGMRQPGDWGGIILLGGAPLNEDGDVLGGQVDTNRLGVPEDWARGGGADESHRCGELRYVRIEFPGYPLTKQLDFDGLRLVGCGTDTVLDHVQVHAPQDDSFVFTGGSAPARHLISSRTGDEGIFFDRGYTGSAQFIVIHAAIDRGDEMIDVESACSTIEPRFTAPQLYNASIVGPSNDGISLNRGGTMTARNVLVTGADAGIHVHEARTVHHAIMGDIVFDHIQLDAAEAVRLNPDAAADCGLARSYLECVAMNCPNGMSQCLADCQDTAEEMDVTYRDRLARFTCGPDDEYYAALETAAWVDTCDDIEPFDEDAWFSSLSPTNLGGVDHKLADPGSPTGLVPAAASPAMNGEAPPGADRHGVALDPSATWVGAFEPGATSTWIDGWTAFPEN